MASGTGQVGVVVPEREVDRSGQEQPASRARRFLHETR
jgi:hypothetical protein